MILFKINIIDLLGYHFITSCHLQVYSLNKFGGQLCINKIVLNIYLIREYMQLKVKFFLWNIENIYIYKIYINLLFILIIKIILGNISLINNLFH